MKAVAMRTPVPKCLERKRKRCGMGSFGNRRAITGNEHAAAVSSGLAGWEGANVPSVLRARMRKRAKTCAAVL